jgi:Putative MetA-pathway of phenol degradation
MTNSRSLSGCLLYYADFILPKAGRNGITVAVFFLFSLCAVQNIFPQEIVTDRPGMGDGTAIVPTGVLQLESGYRFTRVGSDKEHTLGEVLLRVAPAEKLEFRIGVDSYLFTRSPGSDDSGFGDGSLALKYKLFENDNGPGEVNLSTILGTSLPTGSKLYRENSIQPWTQLILDWNVYQNLALTYNLYYSRAGSGSERYNKFAGGVAVSFPLASRTGCFLEYYAVAVESGYGQNTSYFDGGITYLINDNCQVDIHSGLGLDDDHPNYFVGVGLSYLFEL